MKHRFVNKNPPIWPEKQDACPPKYCVKFNPGEPGLQNKTRPPRHCDGQISRINQLLLLTRECSICLVCCKVSKSNPTSSRLRLLIASAAPFEQRIRQPDTCHISTEQRPQSMAYQMHFQDLKLRALMEILGALFALKTSREGTPPLHKNRSIQQEAPILRRRCRRLFV